MKENLQNVLLYIRDVIQLKNKSIYDVKDYIFALDYREFYSKFKEFLKYEEEIDILHNSTFLQIQYLTEDKKLNLPTISNDLAQYVEIYNDELEGKDEDYETQILESGLQEEYLKLQQELMDVKAYNRKIDEYNKIYLAIYNLYKRVTDFEEKIEFFLGTKLMFWRGKNGTTVKRNIIETKLNISINQFNNTINISINTDAKPIYVTDFLNAKGFKVKDSEAFYNMVNSLNDIAVTNDQINIENAVEQYVKLLAYESKIFTDCIQDHRIEELKEGTVYIFDNKYITARYKSKKLWINDLEQLLAYNNEQEINSPILKLLGGSDMSEQTIERLLQDERQLNEEEQILFPLPTNDEQYKIVDRVRNGNIVLVQGPPGTGKSHTIANLISHFIAEGKRVLVTSEKSKALEVIRDKLPEKIRCLSLALLAEKGIDKDLEFSIEQVLKKQEKINELDKMKQDIERFEGELKQLRDIKAENRGKIVEYMRIDSVNNEQQLKDVFCGEITEYNLANIAKWLQKNKQYDIIPLADNENIEYSDLLAMFESLNSVIKAIQLEEYDISKRVEIKEYLQDNSLNQLILEVNKNNNYEVKNKDIKDAILFEKLTPDIIDELQNKINELIRIDDIFSKEWIIENINYTAFKYNLIKLANMVRTFKEKVIKVEQDSFNYSIKYDIVKIATYLPLVDKFINIIEQKQILNSWDKFKYRNEIKQLQEVNIERDLEKIDNLDLEVLKIIKDRLEYDKEIANIKNKINTLYNKDVFKILNINENAFGKTIDNMIEFIELFLDYPKKQKNINMMISNIINTKIIDISYEKNTQEELKNILADLKFYATRDIYLNRIETIDNKILHDYNEYYLKYMNSLIVAVRNCDLQQINEYKERLLNEIDTINKYWNIRETYSNFFEEKKHFCYSYIYEKTDEERNYITQNIENILKYNFVNHYYHLKESKLSKLPELYEKQEELKQKEQKKVIELVETKGWYYQLRNMNSRISTSLGRWTNLRRKYRTGNVKNANIFLRQMQEEMSISKEAIPVWIMPVDKLIEQYPFSEEPPFDVLIMDESSQTSVLSISALTRGKKIIIVGDDKQISPMSVGQSIEEINILRNKYLTNNSWAYILEASTSIYDVVNTLCGAKKVVLTEHFRCLPEIINYSKEHFYDGQINPLKVRGVENTISKPIRTIYVPDAKCRKTAKQLYNQKEIDEIINLISEISRSEQYKNKSVGIIVLQNSDAQIQKLKTLLMQNFGEKFINDRKIKVGDSYDFQGDERDVIILSMIIAPIDEYGEELKYTALTKLEFNRSFNVAASRAKEQMILVHSMKLEELNNNCNRYKLLNYCLTYANEQHKVAEQLFESEFERDVYYALKEKNIELTPQYKVR